MILLVLFNVLRFFEDRLPLVESRDHLPRMEFSRESPGAKVKLPMRNCRNDPWNIAGSKSIKIKIGIPNPARMILSAYFGRMMCVLLLLPNPVNTDPLLFENVGTMVAGLSYVHTQIPVGLLPLMERLDRFETFLHENFTEAKLMQRALVLTRASTVDELAPAVRQWHQVAQSHIQQTRILKQTVASLYFSLPKPAINPNHKIHKLFHKETRSSFEELEPLRTFHDQLGRAYPVSKPTKREKRAILAIAAGAVAVAGIMGTFLGIYNTAQIKQIWAELDRTKEAVNRLITITEDHGRLIHALDDKLEDLHTQMFLLNQFNPGNLDHRLQIVFAQLQEQTHKVVHAIQQAQHRRLAVDFLSHDEIQTLFVSLDHTAKKYGCSLIPTQPSDLFQLETSYFFDGETVTLLLHTPIAPKDSFLRLFKLHPFPVPFSNDSLLIPDVKNDVLGISNTNERLSVQFPSTDLLSCIKINTVFLCSKANALARKFENSCLGALYTQNFPAARKLCQFRIEPMSEFAYSLLQNWFMIYSPKHTILPFTCQNGTTGEHHLKKGITRFHLSAGCSAEMTQYRLVSDLSVTIPSDTLLVEMDWESFNILPTEKELILPQLKKLKDLGASSFTFSEIRSLIASDIAHPSYVHYIHYVFNALAGLTIFILLFMFMRWVRRRCLKRKELLQKQKLALQSAAIMSRLANLEEDSASVCTSLRPGTTIAQCEPAPEAKTSSRWP